VLSFPFGVGVRGDEVVVELVTESGLIGQVKMSVANIEGLGDD
jgi:hypothetical protein